MLKLMLITKDPELARFAAGHGVQRLFVDLEVMGKQARQGHRDTLISDHGFVDVRAVRSAVAQAELLVRLNPLHDGSEAEIEQAIAAGADLIMLPMFHDMEAIGRFTRAIAGRCCFVPLVETPEAVTLVPELLADPGVDEVYVGLNDLHMARGLDFMFELLADGTVERIAAQCRDAGKPFGFGGIARVEEGLLPGWLVLAEHLRLGSSAVILSRTFHRAAQNLDEIRANLDFGREVERLREHEVRLAGRDAAQVAADHQALLAGIAEVVAHIQRGRAQA